MLTVCIIGQSWLAAGVFRALAAMADVKIEAISPDRTDRFDQVARNAGIPVTALNELPPCDVTIAAHCHRYVPTHVRARARLGVLAYHPSLLPRHRGRDAVHWTIAMGDPIAGGTVYWMDDGADTGPIALQDWCHVYRGDTARGLWRRALGPMGLSLLTGAVKILAADERLPGEAQDPRAATWEPALSRPGLARGGC